MLSLAERKIQRQSFTISATAMFTVLLLLALVSLLSFIVVRGAGYFWPLDVYQLTFDYNEQRDTAYVQSLTGGSESTGERQFYRFRYGTSSGAGSGTILSLDNSEIVELQLHAQAAVVKLHDGRTLLGEMTRLYGPTGALDDFALLEEMREAAAQLAQRIDKLRREDLADIHAKLAEMDRRAVSADAPARLRYSQRFSVLQGKVEQIHAQLAKYRLELRSATGQIYPLLLVDVVAHYRPGGMSIWQKSGHALFALWRFVSESPKLNNQAGGVFPALFGTILMVLLMTVLVTPLGVLAAVYLNEYAPQNRFTSLIRISVNNLAGVPSVVYGVFGLGFFVYTLGGSLDALLFGSDFGAPVFGAPGLFWASLTMAILTLPVVIVATEEGLKRVPNALRRGSYALGATQAETIFKTVLPIASPGIMTGIILAIARGAGEVAPLMLVGAVKFAPSLPIDDEFPFFHIQRQFMHLGVMVYDGAFHNENFGTGSSFMFASCLLLLLIVFVLNLLAISIRNRLRRQYGQF